MKEIVSALYGANETYTDVSHIISYLILGNEQILISNAFFGDSVEGINKQLIILYSDGKTSVFNEMHVLRVTSDGEYPLWD